MMLDVLVVMTGLLLCYANDLALCYPLSREDSGGFYRRSSGYIEVSIDNRSALCDKYDGVT
jgi:hypothetical protein